MPSDLSGRKNGIRKKSGVNQEGKMQLSKYLIFLKEKEDVLGYSTLNSNFARFDKEAFNAFQEKKFDKIPKQLIKELKKKMFLLEDGFDELSFLKVMSNKIRYSFDNLILTILPTLSCNFNCIYCYETKPAIFMDENISEGVINFVKPFLPKIQEMNINWYGGEPLLGKKIIFSLSKRLIEECKKNNCKYNAHITTNGYLLTGKVAQQLKERCKVSSAQVTLDGPPSIHDKRRMLINGKGTFDRILKNIKETIDYLPVQIGSIIDKTNVDSIPFLLDILKEEGLAGTSKVTVNFAPTSPVTETCKGVSNYSLDAKAFSRIKAITYKETSKRGFHLLEDFPYTKMCAATTIHSFVIDPYGDIHKCWNTVGNRKESAGNVATLSNPYEIFGNKNFLKWIEFDPFSFKDCRDCIFLSLCGFQCPYKRIIGEAVKREYCSPLKYNLKEILKIYYYNKKRPSR